MKAGQQQINEIIASPRFALFLIVLGGFALRLWGVTYGLPLLLHPDEPTFVRIAMHFGTGDLNPHWFGNPGNVFMYFLFFCYGLIYVAGRVFGVFSDMTAFVEYYRFHPSIFYLTGRVTEVLLGTASIHLVYKIAARLKNSTAGLIAALFLATSPLHVEHSKYVRIDIMSTFFVLLAVLYCLRLLESKESRHYLAAGACAGLALAAKYPTGAVIATVFFAFLLSKFEAFSNQAEEQTSPLRRMIVFLRAFLFDRQVLLGGLSIFLAFAVTTPYFFLDFKKAFHDLVYEVSTPHAGAVKQSMLAGLWWYISGPMREVGMNTLIEICALGGIVWLLFEKNKKAWIPLSFFALYFFIAGLAAAQFARWIIPLLPFLAIFAGVFVAQIFAVIARRVPRQRLIHAASVTVSVSLVVPQILQSAENSYRLTRPDTRQLCKTWIEQNLPPHSRIAQEHYTYVPTPETTYMLGEAHVNGFYILQKITLADTTFDYYQQSGFDYIMISTRGYDRFIQIPKYRRFYDELFQRGKLVKAFIPDEKEVIGPGIHIFKISNETSNGTVASTPRTTP
ncbi:MAG: glycosyltransferase family 39 protein [candidate division KSB1 bacterium]|nr:glycosyltransferase family 39 protein [candidate division KSB1 bacterium]MDZ7366470.1 glycosyltransferase family 39 protein [candidate division KSB1 bacterium]MDZ7404568.1 glycosyltransferase family 39 protein [candidate division KSB1 bacterium]